MGKDQDIDNPLSGLAKLRQHAEEALADRSVDQEDLTKLSQEEINTLIHELAVHQVELEAQNDELRRAQIELEASRDMYSDLYDFAPVGYVTISNKGLILQANLSCAGMLGYEKSALTGKPFSLFIWKDDQDVFYFHRKILFETSEKQVCEVRLVRKDQTQFYAQLESIAAKNPKGDIVQIRLTITDINERKLAEEALKRSYNGLDRQVKSQTADLKASTQDLKQEVKDRKRAQKLSRTIADRYAAAIAGSTDGIWEWDIRADSVFYSDRFKELLGYSPSEFSGTLEAFRSRLHPEDADTIWAAVQSHLQKHTPYNVEYRLKTKSGAYRWFLARGQAMWDDKGNATYLSGSLQDITDRVEAVQNLKNAFVEIQELKKRLEAEKSYLQEEIKLEHNYESIIGNSDELKYTLYKVEQIAPTDTTVMILGETGTGKEIIARSIHASGPRRERAFVKVNCANLPSSLIESELFGHEKGAFSGAIKRRLGRFEVADGATLFLDEIGELPLELQTKLLRVIQENEFERLGSSKTIKVDVRIVAATNRNLEAEVGNGRFREDLWYRLNVFPITAPPLRNRKEDIPLLVNFFVDKISKKLNKTINSIPKSFMKTLQNYYWPGNIRELEHVIERAVINSSENKLRLMDSLKNPQKSLTAPLKTLENVEHDHIILILEETNWKVSGKNGAAEILGLNPSTLRARMRKLGIRRP